MVAATVLAIAGSGALALTRQRDDSADPRGWPAIAGMDTRAVIELARRLPLSESASPDQPWCDHSAEVAQVLSHDFDEERVASGGGGTVLWGSDLTGTWTMVLERPDATSCVVASGVGYRDGASPRHFFTSAGLSG
ncbi:hypothetical protein IT41_14470 [Paracoccus halophilus]|uniref:Uncharacterized protein n=1 Tax=Paracoccus halophilus TaxID=376733 RepID=A0A099EZM3_9RHOB|nr:hypothetical protein IT41_14470 [Paracoccus halophilus]